MSAVEPATASQPLSRRLSRAGALLRPGVGGFWTWWTHALASWMPLRLRELFGLARERLLLEGDGDSLRLSLERGDADVRALGQVPWSPEAPVADAAVVAPAEDPLARLLAQRVAELPRWLLLPAAAGLRRTMVLPAAAADRLRDVLRFEIERQTPFSAADVRFDARVLGRRADGQLDAELVVVPARTVDAALARLGTLAGGIAGVDLRGEDGRSLGVNLMAGAAGRRRADPWRAWNLALATIAVVATAAMLWQVLDNRGRAADAFEAEVRTRAGQARAVADQKRELVDLVEGIGFLQATRAARPTTVEVMDELARRLPDGTVLQKLSIEDERILMIGTSREASSLVKRLEGSPLWRAPALTGALQPDPRSGGDRFTLTAELAVAQAPARAGGNGNAAQAAGNGGQGARRDP